LNSDYFVSLLWNIEHNKQHSTRIRLYHISTHDGDDFLIRNAIHSYNPNPENYEQLDVTHSYTHKRWRFYGNAGLNISFSDLRKRLSFEFGYEYRYPLKKKHGFIFRNRHKNIPARRLYSGL